MLSKQIFQNANKQYEKKITALKLKMRESQDFISNKYDKLRNEFKQLNLINRKQETELCKLRINSIEVKNIASRDRAKFDNLKQIGRKQNLEFVGILYEKKNKSLNQNFSDLAEKI